MSLVLLGLSGRTSLANSNVSGRNTPTTAMKMKIGTYFCGIVCLARPARAENRRARNLTADDGRLQGEMSQGWVERAFDIFGDFRPSRYTTICCCQSRIFAAYACSENAVRILAACSPNAVTV